MPPRIAISPFFNYTPQEFLLFAEIPLEIDPAGQLCNNRGCERDRNTHEDL